MGIYDRKKGAGSPAPEETTNYLTAVVIEVAGAAAEFAVALAASGFPSASQPEAG